MKKRTTTLLVITIASLFVFGSFALRPVKGDSEGKNKIIKAKKRIPNQYLVVFRQGINGRDIYKLAKKLTDGQDAKIQSVYEYAAKGFAVEMSEKNAIKLSEDDNVEFVEENGEVEATQSSCSLNATEFYSYAVDRIDQRSATRDGVYCPTRTGRGVNLYVYRQWHLDGTSRFWRSC